jgi:hypothetical protein
MSKSKRVSASLQLAQSFQSLSLAVQLFVVLLLIFVVFLLILTLFMLANHEAMIDVIQLVRVILGR